MDSTSTALTEFLAAEEPQPVPLNPQGIDKVRYNHEAMIDAIIAQPWISQNALALMFNRTPAWISMIISSDAFQTRLHARREALIDPAIRREIEAGFKALCHRSIDILMQKLNKPAADVPDQLAARVFDLSSRALDYGVRPKVEVNMDLHLDGLANRLDKLIVRKREGVTVDAESPTGD